MIGKTRSERRSIGSAEKIEQVRRLANTATTTELKKAGTQLGLEVCVRICTETNDTFTLQEGRQLITNYL